MAFGAIVLVGCTSVTQTVSDAKVKAGVSDEIETLSDGTKYIVHPSEILSGGPSKDGIPSIDNPKFQPGEEGDWWLNDDDLVLGLESNKKLVECLPPVTDWMA